MHQAPPGLAVGKIDVLICTGRNNIKLGIEHIDAVYHAIQARHGVRAVGLILPDTVTGPGDFLVGGGYNEIGCIHGDQVGGELAGEVVVLLVVTPVQVGIQVLGLFQRMRNVALRHTQTLRQQRRHQVAVGIVTDDEIGPPPQFSQ